MSLDNAITKLVNDRVEQIISNLIKNAFTEKTRENNNEDFFIDSLKNMTREQQVKIMNHIYTIQDVENGDKYPFYCNECKQVKILRKLVISFNGFTCSICKMTYCRSCVKCYGERCLKCIKKIKESSKE